MAGQLAHSPFPLDPSQLAGVEQLVDGLTVEQLQWTSGYLAGRAAAGVAVSDSSVETVAPALHLTILYGSQTGNGRSVAEQLADQSRASGLDARAISMADYRNADLSREKLLALVVSTHGEGDPPDDAEALWEYLNGPKAPRLEGLKFSVLSLGDSSYARFCQTGKEFDQRLAELGAQRYADRVDCDLDFEGPASSWAERVKTSAADLLDEAGKTNDGPILKAVPSGQRVDRSNPYSSEVLANQTITGAGSDRDIRHVEFALEDSGLSYRPGDSLGVWPQNNETIVDEIGTLLGSAETRIELDGDSVSLSDALTHRLELTLLSRSFLVDYAGLTQAGELQALLQPERRDELTAWMAQRQLVDVLREFAPPTEPQRVVDTLRRLTPRLYSVASSLDANPGEAHLTVARVAYQAFAREHVGAASDWLARLGIGDTAPVYVSSNDRFRLPADTDAPVIMIGPGTGVAPFRAFLEQREFDGAGGRNWLFFGNPHFDTDFLYQLDWLRWLKRGVLDRMDVAFSRDQAQKIYVQQRLQERADELWDWLEQGAYVYVCGDAKAMAGDVHSALKDIVIARGHKGPDAAEDYLKTLKRQGRYLKDTY